VAGILRTKSGPRNPCVRSARGSVSSRSTRNPREAKAADAWKHVEVFEQPPLQFKTVTAFAAPSRATLTVNTSARFGYRTGPQTGMNGTAY
jgi:hypothetical protein